MGDDKTAIDLEKEGEKDKTYDDFLAATPKTSRGTLLSTSPSRRLMAAPRRRSCSSSGIPMTARSRRRCCTPRQRTPSARSSRVLRRRSRRTTAVKWIKEIEKELAK